MAYSAASLAAPGVVQHVEGDRFPVGELDGRETERVMMVSDALVKAGLKSRVLGDIRAEIWLKAWGALTFNPISALTRTTMAEICQFPETRRLVVAMMTEAQSIAQSLASLFAIRSNSASAALKRWGTTELLCCKIWRLVTRSKLRR